MIGMVPKTLRSAGARAVLAIVTMTCLLGLVACTAASAPRDESSQTEAADASDAPELEPIPEFGDYTANYGTCMAGDGEHLFFYEKHGISHRIYRTDASLDSPVVIDEIDSERVDALCVADGWLYYAIVVDDDEQDYEIRRVRLDGSDPQSVRHTENEVDQLLWLDGSLICSRGGSLEIGDPKSDKYEKLSPEEGVICHVVATEGGLLLTASDIDGEDGKLYRLTYDGSSYEFDTLAEVGCADSFAVVGDDVYFLALPEDEKDDGDDEGDQTLELMRLDASGGIATTGVRRQFREVDEDCDGRARLVSHGAYVLYSSYAPNSHQWSHFGFDTATGCEFALQITANEYIHHGVQICDATNGFVFLRDTDPSRFSNDHKILDVTEPEEDKKYLRSNWEQGRLYPYTLSTVLEDPDDAVIVAREEAAKAEAEAAAAEKEAAEAAERAEKYKDEPYGPGTSELHLSTGSQRTCYRLVRMDGSTEFMELLEPGESKVMSFPCGRYTLKVAKGTTWISDEEAFGSAGSYSTTNVFTFEEGEAYQISSGERGDFYHDDSGGFLG
ncbi:MAG: hypothetical protein IKF14_07340 [Atopobiaceae bacterium]|nr:hypothetical protein [Atopobiaceae bacterium]